MSRWSKKGAGRGALLPLLLLALAIGGTALYLASLNLLLTTTAWGQNLCQGWAQHQQVGPLRDPSSDAQIFYQNVWEKHQFLYQKLTEERRRHRRSANNNRKNRQSNRKSPPISAAHYEVKLAKGAIAMNADKNGTIRYWTEIPRNSTSPTKYNEGRGEFIVNHKGLYYLYCQVHFNEGRSSYIKLDLLLDGKLIFRCLQEFSATAASIRDPKLKHCSVSGLVILHPGNFLRISTLPEASLRVDNYLTYFGLFQVH
ncbi:tumor necrosis factor ligand superfamily member 12 isoform X4 [Mixophyes fleayi]|uniref:tumor necrosis factor ligand superfamily member 12 isoform X4 n=1 Tax=Mixophyes fleayi TaxID=3061075 RepID=UPI003F4E2AFB